MIKQKRSIDVPEMLLFCLGPYPLSLATVVGNICKATKSKLLQMIESEFSDYVVHSAPEGGCVLLDAMAVLQSTVVLPETYGELTDRIVTRALATARKFNASRVDMVADRYPQLSLKNGEKNEHLMAQETCISTEGIRKYLNRGRTSFQVAEIKRICSHFCWNLGKIWTDSRWANFSCM